MDIKNFIISILVILALILVFLILIEKKLKQKLKLQRNSRNLFYKRKIKRLNRLKLKPQEFLDSINDIARDFFKEAFDLPYNLEYSELVSEFEKRKKEDCVAFCKLISELNYSGKKIEKNKLITLSKLLEKIIDKNKIDSENK